MSEALVRRQSARWALTRMAAGVRTGWRLSLTGYSVAHSFSSSSARVLGQGLLSLSCIAKVWAHYPATGLGNTAQQLLLAQCIPRWDGLLQISASVATL